MLGEKNVEVAERQYFKQKPTIDEVKAIAALLPDGLRGIVSQRSRKYKELGLNLDALSDAELVRLLADEPGLWRRPIVIAGDRAVVGFDQKSLQALLE